MAFDLLRFPRGLDKLYDILDGSWMSAVTGGLYKVALSDLKPRLRFVAIVRICVSCVNFPRKQCNFSHNLSKTTRFTHTSVILH